MAEQNNSKTQVRFLAMQAELLIHKGDLAFPSVMSYPVSVAIGSITAGQVIARVPHCYFVVARDKLHCDGGVCRIL